MEQIGVAVRLEGAEAVLKALREIDALGNRIDGKTYTAKLGTSQAKAAESIRRTTKALTGQETAYRGVAASSQSAIKNADRLVKSLRGMKDFKWAEEPIGVLGNVKTVQNEVKRAIDGVNRSIEKEHHQFRQLGKENRKLHDEMEYMSDEEKVLANKRIALNTKERNAIRERIGDLREQKTTLGNYNRELTNEYGRIQKVYDAQKSLNKAEEARWKSAQERHDRMWNYQDLSRGRRAVTGGKARLSGITNTPRRLRTPLAIDAAEQAALKAHEERVQAIKRAYNGISGTMSRVGASFTTLGNTITRITSPFGNIVRGAAYGIGYGAINKVTEGLSSGFARYDIMKQYGLTMANFSKKNYDASDSIKELDLSVRGLPTGLDQIVNMAQRFTMTAGSMRQGTKLAIATNRAFLASMSTDSQKYQGMLQLQDVIGGKKMQSREWASLVASMPFAVREIGKALGYSGKNLDKWVRKVQQGKVANKEFLNGLKKAGGENGTLKKYADYTKQTWGAFAQNIGNAFSRMTAGIIGSLDSVTKIMTKGKFDSLNSFLADSFIPGIDNATAKIKGWIEANPDKIIGFFDKIRSYDWSGLARGFGQGVTWLADMVGELADAFGGGDAETLGRRMVQWNVIGHAISIFGGALKGLAPLGGLMGMGIKALAGAKITKLIKGLAALKGAEAAVDGAKTLGKVGGALKTASVSWQGVASMALGIASIPAIAGSMWMAANALKKLSTVNMSWDRFSNNMKMIGRAFAEFLGAAAVIGTSLFALTSAGPGGWAVLGAGAGGLAAIAGIAKDMSLAAEGINSIATAKVPEIGQIKSFTKSMTDVVRDLGEAGKELPRDAVENAKKFSGIGGAMKSIQSIGETIPKIASLNLDKDQIQKATESITALKPAITSMKSAIAELFGEEVASSHETSNGRGRAGEHTVTNRKKFDMESLKDSSETTAMVEGMMQSVISVVQSFKKFAPMVEDLTKKESIQDIGTKVSDVITEIGGIASSFNIQQGKIGEVGDLTEPLENIKTAIGKLKGIVKSIQGLSEGLGDGADANALQAPIRSITTAINGMVTQFQGILPKVSVLDGVAIQLRLAVDSIKQAFQGLQNIGTIDVSGAINGITSSIAQINGTQIDVSPLVSKLRNAASRIKAAWSNLMGAYKAIKSHSKSITISVSVDVGGAVANINAAASRLRAAWSNLNSARHGGGAGGGGGGAFHTGGLVDGGSKPVYRAGGGTIFKPKGTDTVPAMLTPGEYVQRKKAVDYFGVGFMQKLNHLDLEGALRSMSRRASRSLTQPISHSVTNNITNRTNNARVNQKIYTTNQNYTFRRANRFVGAL